MRKKKKKQTKRNKAIIITISGILFALAIIIVILANLPAEQLAFDFVKEQGNWTVPAGIKTRIIDNAIELQASNNPYIVIPNLNIDADRYDVIALEVKQPIAYTQGRILFISQFNQAFDQNYGVVFDTGMADRWNCLWINMKKHGAWKGCIKGILVIPSDGSFIIQIRRIHFIHTNLWQKIIAWWSDFTRYYDPLLGTCFSIASPYFIFGAFNILITPWLFAMLGLVLVIILIVKLFKFRLEIAKYVLILFFTFFIILWGILDLRNNIYYFKAICRDANLYWGKSLFLKRQVVTGDPEFIRFMKFCDDSLPLDGYIYNCVSEVMQNTPYNYLASTQVNFNLQPRPNNYRQYLKGKDEPYYIFYKTTTYEVFGVPVAALKFFKQYNKDAFIMTQ